MNVDLTPDKSKKLRTLQRRHDFLASNPRNSWEAAEVAALAWAIEVLTMHLEACQAQRAIHLAARRAQRAAEAEGSAAS